MKNSDLSKDQIIQEFKAVKKRAVTAFAVWIGVIVAMIVVALVARFHPLYIFGAAFLVGIFYVFPRMLKYRCPACHTSLSQGGSLMLSVSFCPSCGIALK